MHRTTTATENIPNACTAVIPTVIKTASQPTQTVLWTNKLVSIWILIVLFYAKLDFLNRPLTHHWQQILQVFFPILLSRSSNLGLGFIRSSIPFLNSWISSIIMFWKPVLLLWSGRDTYFSFSISESLIGLVIFSASFQKTTRTSKLPTTETKTDKKFAWNMKQ